MSMLKMKNNELCIKEIEQYKSKEFFKKNNHIIHPEKGNVVIARILWFGLIDNVLQGRKIKELSDEELGKIGVFSKYEFLISRVIHSLYRYNNENKLENLFCYCEKDAGAEKSTKLAREIINKYNINNYNEFFDCFIKEKTKRIKDGEYDCKICNIMDDIKHKYTLLLELKKENDIDDAEFNNDLEQLYSFLKFSKKIRFFIPAFIINDKLHPENNNQVKMLLFYDYNIIYNFYNLLTSMRVFYNNLSKPGNYNIEVTYYEYKNIINNKIKLIKNINPVIDKDQIKSEEDFYNVYITNTGFDINQFIQPSNNETLDRFYNFALEMLNTANIICDKYNIFTSDDINKKNTILAINEKNTSGNNNVEVNNNIIDNTNTQDNSITDNTQEEDIINTENKENEKTGDKNNKENINKKINTNNTDNSDNSDDFIDDFINSLDL